MLNIPGTNIPYYAFFLPALPPLVLFSKNLGRLTISHGILTILACVVGFLLVMGLLRLVFRRPEITDALWAIVYSAVFMPVMFLNPDEYRIPWVLGWLALGASLFLWNGARRLVPILATIFAVGNTLPLLYNVVTSGTWADRTAITSVVAGAFDADPVSASEPAEKPDIYYFVFDRYARQDQLKAVYGYDNTEFLAALRQRGFFIADNAYSNYQRTTHSVISSLNFDYLDRVDTPATQSKADWLPLYQMFQDFRIARFLKGLGYEVHFSGTWWEPTRRLAIADVTHNFYELPEITRFIYENSLIVDAAQAIGFRNITPLYWQCQRSRLMFEDVRTAPDSEKPKFHFAHFLIPHPPFVTHESGRCMDRTEALGRSRAQNYTGQLRYANEQILATVDALLAAPGPKPIIILQADEGPWPEKYAGDEVMAFGRDVSNVDWRKATPGELKEKMAIFSAIHAPRIQPASLHPAITPVNTFRLVLRDYFNVEIEPLPDRMMAYENAGDLYHFMNVTETLQGP
ncbi:MAG TPA: sulfatase-like hydrolase/transferase [Aestuariivirga sp.]|nr:sulfatase-like hydrolase/transferase [Aestuariivirga sp.]